MNTLRSKDAKTTNWPDGGPAISDADAKAQRWSNRATLVAVALAVLMSFLSSIALFGMPDLGQRLVAGLSDVATSLGLSGVTGRIATSQHMTVALRSPMLRPSSSVSGSGPLWPGCLFSASAIGCFGTTRMAWRDGGSSSRPRSR